MSPLALSPEASRRGVSRSTGIGLACLAAFFVVLPWLVPNYQQVFIAEILIWGLFAMSFALVFGFGGMLSFAQAVFFGAGCYGFNLGTYYFGFNTWGAVFSAVVAAVLFAIPVGFIATRVRPHHFLIVTVIISVLVVTVLAVGELLIFIGVAAPSFELANFNKNPLPNGWGGVFACLPFAIWFYLAIEGVANVAEEARDPQRTVARGFGSAILTLVVLAVAVFFTSTGVGGWEAIVYETPGAEPSDAPLPLALAQVIGKEHILYTLLLGIGLLGLIASFHGIMLAAGRATMEMGRSAFLPRALGRIVALVVNMLIGIAAILSGRTAEIITLAAFGAVSLYVISMVSLFVLRKNEPSLERPFRAVCYPIFPALALLIAAVSFVAMAWFNLLIGGIFCGILGFGSSYFLATRRNNNGPKSA